MNSSVSDLDYWYYIMGLNVIPRHPKSKIPKFEWEKWQAKPIREEIYLNWKRSGAFNDGCVVIVGLIWRGEYKGKYLACIDIDNSFGIKVFVSKFDMIDTLQELAKKTIVEQHLDASKNKAHVYFIVEKPLAKRSKIGGTLQMSEDIPAIEVKSEGKHGVMCCTPSIHANGHPYQIVGTRIPLVLNRDKSNILDDKLDDVYATFGSHSTNSNLSPELRIIANTLLIGTNAPIISEGTRSNTLIAFGRLLLNQNFQRKDIDLKAFFAEVNQKLCDPPLPQDELKAIWNKDLQYLLQDLESGKLKAKRKDDDENCGGYPTIKSKTESLVFKYALKGQMYESVIVGDKPFFLTIQSREVILESFLEEETRILRPPALEEYPSYSPYKFKDIDAINRYIELINSQPFTLDNLAYALREQTSKYIVHHDHVLDYITALMLFSYFQDRFPTVPYTMFVSDNGSGKSTIGNVFECFGYRCVNMTDPTTANIFRIFGTIEAGQCILVLDEAEKIDQVQEMMSILKSGYENGKKVQRINHLGKQEHFQTYGIKIMLAERTPNSSIAKGVLDRTVIISNYKGSPQLDIKERKNSQRGKIEFSFLKNLLLIYRLMNFNNKIDDLEIGLDGRDKELCKPLLQFFFETKFQSRLEGTLERLLDEKNLRKSNSLERDLLEIVDGLLSANWVDRNGIIEFSEIWNKLVEKTNGQVDEFKSNQLDTEMYGRLYKRTVSNILRDRFGAEDPKHRNAVKRSLRFDRKRIKDFLTEYTKESTPTKIICKSFVSDSSDSSDSNFESLCNKFFSPLSDSFIQKYKENIEVGQVDRVDEDFNIKNRPAGSDPSKGLEISVTTVTKVTDPEPHRPNIAKSYPHSDIWICHNCNDRGDRHYMKIHLCKNNNK